MALFDDTVSHKKKFLASLVKAPLEQLAIACGPLWGSTDALTQNLQQEFRRLPHCQLLYVLDTTGRQISANVNRQLIDNTWQGQDLSTRPYLQGNLPYRGMTLSAAYLSARSMQPCITALQAIRHQNSLLGFIAADFSLKELPEISAPALRRMLRQSTQQGRENKPAAIISAADDHLDYLTYILITLLQEHGVFQFQLHFNSARCVLWSSADPLNYHLHDVADLLKPELFVQYPKQAYCAQASINTEKIPQVLAQIKTLREISDANMLRSASFNIVNSMVSLSFVSDGTCFMSADEFLNQELHHWLGMPLPTAALTDSTSTKN